MRKYTETDGRSCAWLFPCARHAPVGHDVLPTAWARRRKAVPATRRAGSVTGAAPVPRSTCLPDGPLRPPPRWCRLPAPGSGLGTPEPAVAWLAQDLPERVVAAGSERPGRSVESETMERPTDNWGNAWSPRSSSVTSIHVAEVVVLLPGWGQNRGGDSSPPPARGSSLGPHFQTVR